MTGAVVVMQFWAAVAAYRAADVDRFVEETGVSPESIAISERRWSTVCRSTGSGLVAGGTFLALDSAGWFEGAILALSAAMFGCVGMILLAPVARRLAWGVAAVSLAAPPVALLVSLL
ncbi:MAG: hypothetical protein ABEL76_16095 [Bradymonadaceae bacterium]